MQCSCGQPMREVAQTRERISEEVVVYRPQRIKHFDREGSEYWAEVKMPDIELRDCNYAVVDWRCDACGASQRERSRLVDNTEPIAAAGVAAAAATQ
jgi:hypothetical protein